MEGSQWVYYATSWCWVSLQFFIAFKFVYGVYACMDKHVHRGTQATVYVWRSADSLWKLVLSFYYVDPGIELRLSHLAASTFTHSALLSVWWGLESCRRLTSWENELWKEDSPWGWAAPFHPWAGSWGAQEAISRKPTVMVCMLGLWKLARLGGMAMLE